MANDETGAQWSAAEIEDSAKKHLLQPWEEMEKVGQQARTVLGTGEGLNQNLEKAGRVADFYEFAELMARDALERNESCGGHFREESQTPEGEAQRDDTNFSHAAVWEYTGEKGTPVRHREELTFEHCKPSQRSYK